MPRMCRVTRRATRHASRALRAANAGTQKTLESGGNAWGRSTYDAHKGLGIDGLLWTTPGRMWMPYPDGPHGDARRPRAVSQTLLTVWGRRGLSAQHSRPCGCSRPLPGTGRPRGDRCTSAVGALSRGDPRSAGSYRQRPAERVDPLREPPGTVARRRRRRGPAPRGGAGDELDAHPVPLPCRTIGPRGRARHPSGARPCLSGISPYA